jgi:hypothetical protein
VPNPNFLTANTSGIELMPGVNDTAQGYDVNRIIQALNGTNIIPITTGDLAVRGTLNVTGAVTFSSLVGPVTINPGGLTVSSGDVTISAGRLVLGAAASKIVPGTTSLSLRNNADSADNLLISDVGVVTSRSNLVVGGTTLSLNNAGSGNAPFVFGDATNIVFEVAGAGTYQFKDSGGTVRFAITPAAATKLVPGATSLSLRNNGDTADNLILTDAGAGTMRNSLSMPPSAGGTVAATSYGTIPVKIAEIITTSGQANPKFTSIPSGFRHLEVVWTARDNSAGTTFASLLMRFNNDSGANYYQEYNIEGGSANTPTESLGATSGFIGHAVQGGATDGNAVGRGWLYIPNYADGFKKVAVFNSGMRYGTGGNTGKGTVGEFGWDSTAAINEIDFILTFVANCVLTLYGIP